MSLREQSWIHPTYESHPDDLSVKAAVHLQPSPGMALGSSHPCFQNPLCLVATPLCVFTHSPLPRTGANFSTSTFKISTPVTVGLPPLLRELSPTPLPENQAPTPAGLKAYAVIITPRNHLLASRSSPR